MGNIVNITNNEKPSVWTVAKDYVQTSIGMQNLLIRPVVHGLRFTELALTALAPTVKGPRELFKLADHLLYWVWYPNRLKNFDTSVRKLERSIYTGSVWKVTSKVSKVYINTMLVVGLVADGIKNLYTRGLIPLDAPYLAVLEQISFLGSIGLLLFSLHQIKKQVKVLMKSVVWSPEFNLALIRLIGRVCLSVIAGIGIASYFAANLVSPWISLGFSVGLLITSLTAHFYDKIHVPKGLKSV
jgi:hypothetical protein